MNHKKYWSRKTRHWVSPPPLSSCLSICPSTRDSLFLTLLICMIGIKDHVWLAHRFAMEIVMEIYMKGVVNYLATHGCLPSHLPNSRTYLKIPWKQLRKESMCGLHIFFPFWKLSWSLLKPSILSSQQTFSKYSRACLWKTRFNLMKDWILSLQIYILGTSLLVQWWRIHLPMQGTQVRSLVGELRFHMPQGN